MMTALQFAIHQVGLSVYNCPTKKAIEDLGPSGLACTYVKLNDWCGVKLFRKTYLYKSCLANHLDLLKNHGAAPLIFGTVSFDNPAFGSIPGILVEHVTTVYSLGNKWERANYKEFQSFCQEMLEYFNHDTIADDLHNENVAYKNGKFLMIDFSI